MEIQKIDTPLGVITRKRRGTQFRDIRTALSNLAVSEGIRVVFDEPKKSMGGFVYLLIQPLDPKKFSYRTLDDQTDTPGKVVGIWRTK